MSVDQFSEVGTAQAALDEAADELAAAKKKAASKPTDANRAAKRDAMKAVADARGALRTAIAKAGLGGVYAAVPTAVGQARKAGS